MQGSRLPRDVAPRILPPRDDGSVCRDCDRAGLRAAQLHIRHRPHAHASPGFPTFFGTPGITIEQRYTLKKDGANVNWWHVPEHAGTHLDAPFHYSDAGAAVEAIPAEQLIVPFAVVDVSAKAARNPDYAASRDDLAEWEGKNGRLPDGCCVAMHSGWAQHASNAAKFTGKDA